MTPGCCIYCKTTLCVQNEPPWVAPATREGVELSKTPRGERGFRVSVSFGKAYSEMKQNVLPSSNYMSRNKLARSSLTPLFRCEVRPSRVKIVPDRSWDVPALRRWIGREVWRWCAPHPRHGVFEGWLSRLLRHHIPAYADFLGETGVTTTVRVDVVTRLTTILWCKMVRTNLQGQLSGKREQETQPE